MIHSLFSFFPFWPLLTSELGTETTETIAEAALSVRLFLLQSCRATSPVTQGHVCPSPPSWQEKPGVLCANTAFYSGSKNKKPGEKVRKSTGPFSVRMWRGNKNRPRSSESFLCCSFVSWAAERRPSSGIVAIAPLFISFITKWTYPSNPTPPPLHLRDNLASPPPRRSRWAPWWIRKVVQPGGRGITASCY